MKKRRFLAVIPARAGSKRIPNKNIRSFNGRPLIYYAIKQAKDCGFFDRIIVDTDSKEIAEISKRYGAEVPFLRPARLARDRSKIADSLAHLLAMLKKEQNYQPDVIAIIQSTSPLREPEDIEACYRVMLNPKNKSVATVCQTSPWFWNFSDKNELVLVNRRAANSTNTGEIKKGFFLNGAVFMCRTDVFMRSKKSVYFYNGETIGVVCPGWRSVDLDHPEEWVLAETIHRNKKEIVRSIKSFK